MNLAVLDPSSEKKSPKGLMGIFKGFLKTPDILIREVPVVNDLSLIICNIPVPNGNAMPYHRLKRRYTKRIERMLIENRVFACLAHQTLKGMIEYAFPVDQSALHEIILHRFFEVLQQNKALGRLSRLEITVTGSPVNLEFALTKLISHVKYVNLLIPEGSREPGEAESAFEETGIPIHITSDTEVLDRTHVWIRFPNDAESFDTLPEAYGGIIFDVGALRWIDTQRKRIYAIAVELPESLKKEIGYEVIDRTGSDRLSAFLVSACSRLWNLTATDASIRLGMRLLIKP